MNILITNGRLIDQTGDRLASVRISDGIMSRSATSSPQTLTAAGTSVSSMPPGWSSVPASSIYMFTFVNPVAKRLRPSRLAAEVPRSVGLPLSWQCRIPIPRRTRSE